MGVNLGAIHVCGDQVEVVDDDVVTTYIHFTAVEMGKVWLPRRNAGRVDIKSHITPPFLFGYRPNREDVGTSTV